MKITPTNNTSFQSKIVFVPSSAFKSENAKYFYCKETNALKDSMTKACNVWTDEIRTCTGGGIADKDGVLGFHFYDSIGTLNRIKSEFSNLIKTLNQTCKSALLIGSKDMKNNISAQIFDATLNEVEKVTTPSIFKEYTNSTSESNIAFSSADDTWLVNTNFLKHPGFLASAKDILSLDDLVKNFKKIQIAPQDKLFIENTEITREMCPEIFA